MRALLIDPNSKSIEEVEIVENENEESLLDNFYSLIGCEMIEMMLFPTRDHAIIVDEEFLMKNPEPETFYYIRHLLPIYPDSFAGKGIIIGYNREEDEFTSCTLSVDEIRNSILFIDD